MRNPVILLSCGFTPGTRSPQRALSVYYGDAFALAGALPVVYAGGEHSDAAMRFDGLVLTGGGDLAPAYYGQIAQTDTLSIDPVRDEEEWSLLQAFTANRKPVLGICRGMQTINVFFGGTLAQHIEGHDSVHPVHTLPCSRLEAFCGQIFAANSYHHQAVAAVGDSLRVTARAADGVPEGLEHATLPVLGVQWHPERQSRATCMDTPQAQDGLFAGFTALCAGRDK